MVYCVKCGNQNPDDAEYCIKCGASLEVSQKERWEKHEKGKEAECFGIRWSARDWGLLWGIIILLAGVIWLLDQYIPRVSGSLWSILIIIIGVFIIIKVLSKPKT